MKQLSSQLWRLALLLGLSAGSAAAADVTFGVNMQYRIIQGQFTPGTDQVVVLGSFSGAGVALTDPDGDKIYTGTVTGQAADNQLTYSFRFAHGGGAVNETVAARKYVVQPTTAANVLADWFNDEQSPYPYAKFFASSVKTIPGEVVRFNDASEGGAATSWKWTFQGGNPAASTAQNPTATWSAPGTYAVNLTTTNASGSTTARALTVTVTTVDNVLGWWNDAVFYQIYPRSFLDTDGNGTGDLKGLISKLDYLNDGNATTTTDLGVTALYIMPVHAASRPYYGGYEVTDYKSIIAEYGTQADFDQFVAEAHQRGMKVIMDMVFNHTSDEHPWFQSAAQGAGGKYDDYYVFRADNPGSAWHPNTVGHGDPTFNTYWGKFGVKTPDLNFNSRSVRNTVKDVSSFWLGKSVDGFRLDAPMFLYETGDAITDAQQQNQPAAYAYWRGWRSYVKAANPNAFTVGETWLLGDVPGAAKYVYQGFDVGFQFDIAYGLEDALNNESKSFLQNPVEQSLAYYPFLQFGVFASNHDLYVRNSGNFNALRLKDRLANNKDGKAKVAAAWVLTAPGVPFVYYGDEVGASGGFARKPMQWTNGANGGFTTGNAWEAVAADYAAYNVQVEQNDPNSFLSLYKSLIAVRKAQVALRRGGYQTVTSSANGVYSFVRTYGTETVVVVLNLSAAAQNNVALSVTSPALAPGTYALDNLLSPGAPAANTVTVGSGGTANWVPYATIPANGFYVLKLRSAANSAPTINPVVNQTLNLENGAQTVPLTGITDGGGSKAVTVTATSSATGVVGAPTVAYTANQTTGTLTLTPQAAGTATVTLTVKDNIGAAPNGFNSKTTSFTATVTDLPNAPTGLALAQASSTSAGLSWTDNSGREAGYRLYWATSNTKPATANATVGANTTSYTADSLRAPATYYFWVEAYGPNGSSAAATGTLALAPPPGSAPTYYIVDRWKGTYLYDNGSQQVAYAAAANGVASQWMLESFNGTQRIKNVGTGGYMNIENLQAPYVQCSYVPDFFGSGQWLLEPYDGYTRIRNAWQGTYLNVENQTGYAQCWDVYYGAYSNHWTLQAVGGATALRGPLATAAAGPAAPKTPLGLTIYPNPAGHGALTLLLPAGPATARLRLLDGQGRVVLDRAAAVANGQARLDVTGLAAGLYLLQATAGGATYTGKVAIE